MCKSRILCRQTLVRALWNWFIVLLWSLHLIMEDYAFSLREIRLSVVRCSPRRHGGHQ